MVPLNISDDCTCLIDSNRERSGKKARAAQTVKVKVKVKVKDQSPTRRLCITNL